MRMRIDYGYAGLSGYADLPEHRRGPFRDTPKGRVGPGCRWTVGRFRHFLRGQDVNEPLLWQRVNNMVTLTLLSIAPSVPPCANCVELFGFDVLVDSEFRPWLLEVNRSPSLSLQCPTDVEVKTGLIGDLVDLMSYTATDRFRDRAGRNPSAPLLPEMKGREVQRKSKTPWRSRPEKRRQTGFRQQDSVALGFRAANSTAGETCTGRNRILGSYAETDRTGPALSSRQTGLTNRDKAETEAETEPEPSGENEVASSVPDTGSRRSTSRPATDSSRLPNIHRGSQRLRVQGPEAPPGPRLPPARVGGFIRTFPFNRATLRASRDTLDVPVILRELQALTARVASGRRDEADDEDDDCSDSLLWGPEDPPPLSRRFKTFADT